MNHPLLRQAYYFRLEASKLTDPKQIAHKLKLASDCEATYLKDH